MFGGPAVDGAKPFGASMCVAVDSDRESIEQLLQEPEERARRADERDRVAEEREQIADERERHADERDRLLDERERLLNEREHQFYDTHISRARRRPPAEP